MNFSSVKIEIYIPVTHLDMLREVLRSAGAGASEKYDSALSYSPVKGCWRPLPGAKPYRGKAGVLCEADEYKVEVSCPLEKLKQTIKAIRAIHPYEEPVINVIPLIAL